MLVPGDELVPLLNRVRLNGALNTRPDLMPLLVRDRPRRDFPLVARRIGEAIALVELRGEDQDT